MADAIIRAHGLTKRYGEGTPGEVLAVDGIDLEIRAGEIYGLLGPNGAGKSTTIGMLTTRVIPTAGTALVGGIDVVKRPAEAKRLIVMGFLQEVLEMVSLEELRTELEAAVQEKLEGVVEGLSAIGYDRRVSLAPRSEAPQAETVLLLQRLQGLCAKR